MIVLGLIGVFLLGVGIVAKYAGDAMWRKQQDDLAEAARWRSYLIWLKANHPEHLTNK